MRPAHEHSGGVKNYEGWMRKHAPVVESHLRDKHVLLELEWKGYLMVFRHGG
jgi:hypothetical protein